MPDRDLLNDLHPCLSEGYIMFGLNHGWRWMPRWLGSLLAHIWNPLVCWRGQHYWMGDGPWDDATESPVPVETESCSHCGRTRRAVAGGEP